MKIFLAAALFFTTLPALGVELGQGVSKINGVTDTGGGVTIASSSLGYTAATPGNWTVVPTVTNDAIDKLAAKGASIGGAITSGTTGSLLFVGAGAVFAQDNANAFWDVTNHRLGIGTTAPADQIDVRKAGFSVLSGVVSDATNRNAASHYSDGTHDVYAGLLAASGSGTAGGFAVHSGGAIQMVVGNGVGIGTLAPSGARLEVMNPGGQVFSAVTSDATTLNAATRYGDGSHTYYVGLLGASGGGSGNLAFHNGSGVVAVLDTSGKLGIGTATPLSALDVSGGAAIGSYAGANAAPANGLVVSGKVGVGTASPLAALDVQEAVTAAAGVARGVNAQQTLNAAANNDVLTAIRIAPTFNQGAFTGVKNVGLSVTAGAYVGIGTTTPLAPLDMGSNPTAIRLGSQGVLYGSVQANDYIDPFNGVWSTPGGGHQFRDATGAATWAGPTAAGVASSVLQNDGSGNTTWVKPTRTTGTPAAAGTCTATCASGVAVGGGCQHAAALSLQNSYPSSATVWSCAYLAYATGNCTAYVICQ